MSVRVRFAPSPTGHVHIGNIRAAIFNWLFARHEGGVFLLRVEDTDRERSTEEAKTTLFEALDWLGLSHDEAVMYQSTRAPMHLEAARRLEAAGRAYTWRRGPDEEAALYFRMPYEDAEGVIRPVGPVTIEVHPDEPVWLDHTGIRYAQVGRDGRPIPTACCLAGVRDLCLFDASGACIFRLADHLDHVQAGGETSTLANVVRLSFMRREVVFRDLVKGELAKPLDGFKDLVIVRGNGLPVFHLANVCDDIAQRVTHIIRGDDHVENTYRHVLLFHALGAPPPQYAHLPMIVNDQGKPYSKRDGDAYVGDFRARGFEPDALFNYLALLGWSPGDDREKMTRAEMIEAFTLDRVKSAPARMDLQKLTHLNGQYLAALPAETFIAAARSVAAAQPWGASVDEAYFRRVCALMQIRTHVYAMVEGWRYFFTDEFPYDEAAVKKNLRKEGRAAALAALRGRLANGAFDEAAVEAALRDTERAVGLGEHKLNQPVRVAVTGVATGAGLYETLALLGRETVFRRLDHAMAHWCG